MRTPAGPTLFVLVTCSLEESRDKVLQAVVDNLSECASRRPGLLDDMLVVDNASTMPATPQALKARFPHVWQTDRNVGYWSAIDWALRAHRDVLGGHDYRFVYVIESDMVHYALERLVEAESFLASRPDIGAVRCQEYSVAEQALYDKGAPMPGSCTWAWQSHVHRFTGQRIEHRPSGVAGIYETDFLTQLPALNRLTTLQDAFRKLRLVSSFAEPDFQRLCYEPYPVNALLDGGIYHCRLGAQGTGTTTGSWTPADVLRWTGYQETRRGKIVPAGSYTVVRA